MSEKEEYAFSIADRFIGGEIPLNKRIKKLGEEVMELAMAIQKEEYEGHTTEEIGDCMFILAHIGKILNPDKPIDEYLEEAAMKMRIRNLQLRDKLTLKKDISHTIDGEMISWIHKGEEVTIVEFSREMEYIAVIAKVAGTDVIRIPFNVIFDFFIVD